MPNYLRALCQRAAEHKAGEPMRFIASTEGVKRDGKNLDMSRWRLENYRKNPVFLWVHDYWGTKLPLGRAEAQVEERQLLADVTFDQEDEFARQVESKYARGFLHTVSVGWDETKEGYDLLDISAVPVPGDPDALIERQYRALQSILEPPANAGALETLPREPIWRGVAAAMADLYRADGELADEQRLKLYNDLARVYRRLDREPPEYHTLAELQALGPDEIRGLFLHDEFTRVGQVLSSRNRDDLEQAVKLVQAVLDRAAKEQSAHDTPAEGAPAEGAADERAMLDVLGDLRAKLDTLIPQAS